MWFGGPPGSLSTEQHGNELPLFWREHVEEVREFKNRCHELVLELLVCFAIAMELPDRDFFASKDLEDNPRGIALRLLHYPAASHLKVENGTHMNAHTDSGSVTLLFQRSNNSAAHVCSVRWESVKYCERVVTVMISAYYLGNAREIGVRLPVRKVFS
jgi:isopenicillin N synthase-like dioxygenase